MHMLKKITSGVTEVPLPFLSIVAS
eukprot:COSAG01_NODE_13297_length_1605_cov_1.581009_2_plen_24_part_01